MRLRPVVSWVDIKIVQMYYYFFSYLCVQAEKFHKSPTHVMNDLIHEKLAVGA
jgi:hypothetical protein